MTRGPADFGNPLKGKTALGASKLALKELDSLTSPIPHGAALSIVIKRVLAFVETVEVSGTTL